MGFKKLKNKPWFRILSNKYILVLLAFGIWMLFFDSNSWLVQRELNAEIKKLENSKEYYQKEIEHDRNIIEQLSNDEGLERYGRENYFMKKENEDIFIIEYEDSVVNKKDL